MQKHRTVSIHDVCLFARESTKTKKRSKKRQNISCHDPRCLICTSFLTTGNYHYLHVGPFFHFSHFNRTPIRQYLIIKITTLNHLLFPAHFPTRTGALESALKKRCLFLLVFESKHSLNGAAFPLPVPNKKSCQQAPNGPGLFSLSLLRQQAALTIQAVVVPLMPGGRSESCSTLVSSICGFPLSLGG